MAGLFDLTDKTVVATGATRGIGQSMTIGLAELGADVISLQRDLSNTETQNKVLALGRKFTAIHCDVSNNTKVLQAMREALALTRVDILLNAAGLQRRSPAQDLSYEAYEEVMDANLSAIFTTCQEAGRYWLDKGQQGVIINVASVVAVQGGVNMAAYAASKGGVLQLTRALSNEWAGRGIRVNCVSPGYVNVVPSNRVACLFAKSEIATDINKDVRTEPEYREHYDFLTKRIPMGRWGVADDFKGVAVFMASKASCYMSGENLVIDGGWLAR
ncbi:2-dehydro-3-deoxy-D-gluconate 5-dehydrogenase [Metarhizium robertsii ARSEF 23]|uniref:Hydroxynaphthalene reductase-like protein Arp2 n=1 Tax=Metarhizium robertsii (strain ARSEF 23 / ATCC MYA-3075) TaxID=655844 RepID=E9FAV4_METRA|nr:2-dehydro-3-deoxy-D-gluconate 5-dehydrogenase [Metarhizium robertsii ARSEF 23]EFY95198.1 2-dehydro-3-deoxy-D-gluconate 5-dehydrogenase [Metarhizium robertsii ARSEF 23]